MGSAYAGPSIIFLFFSGYIADNANRKNVYIFFCLVTGVSTFCITVVKDVRLLYPIRILQGISNSFNALFAFSLVKDIFEEPAL
jgi:MFS family permease